MEDDSTYYCGQKANRGWVEPTEIYKNEGYAILKCGGTDVVLTYTALHMLCGNFSAGCGPSNVRDNGNILKALQSIACEASLGGRG